MGGTLILCLVIVIIHLLTRDTPSAVPRNESAQQASKAIDTAAAKQAKNIRTADPGVAKTGVSAAADLGKKVETKKVATDAGSPSETAAGESQQASKSPDDATQAGKAGDANVTEASKTDDAAKQSWSDLACAAASK